MAFWLKGIWPSITWPTRLGPIFAGGWGAAFDLGQSELLGRKVLFLTFDADGSISSCNVVAATGDMAFKYDCEQARSEQFRVQASAATGAHQAFMTVLAYGHSEHLA